MQFRTFGKSDEQVSILGFGCMRLPVIDGDPTQIDEAQAIPMLRGAIDAGVNYIDTAYPYHSTSFEEPGASEPFVGRALRDGYRDKVMIATKLPSWLIQSADDMERILDHQLERLQTDHIDCYLLHSMNKVFWPNLVKLGALDFLDRALADGRIRQAGFSHHDDLELFKTVVDAYPWSFCQIQYNYLDETFQAGRAGLEYAAQKGLGVVVMEPLRGGNLAGELPEAAAAAFAAAPEQRSHAEWALRWVWNHPEVSTLLSGMSEPWQVEENIRIAGAAVAGAMSSDDLQRIETVKEVYRQRLKVPCTQCRYCMPCPVGVDIPGNLAAYNNFHLFDSELNRFAAAMFYGTNLRPEQKADNCISCGECLEHCPQQINIPLELQNTVATFAREA